MPIAVQSILNQTFVDWELIIVDDGSEDGTREVVHNFKSQGRIHYYFQENQGVTTARNFGVTKASGEFVAFLDSDDTVERSWLKDFATLIAETENPGYLSCGYLRNGTVKLPKFSKQICSKKYASLAGTFSIRRIIFLKIGGYDTVLKQSENWEMTARALDYCSKNGYAIVHTDKVNFSYENHPTADQTKIRDEYRGDATYHLYEKYKNGGVLNFKKDDFLFSSAVNYTRAGKFNKSRKLFYQNLKSNPSFRNLIKVLIFEIPFLRRKKWMRIKNKHE